jgi:hypothetical protein
MKNLTDIMCQSGFLFQTKGKLFPLKDTNRGCKKNK